MYYSKQMLFFTYEMKDLWLPYLTWVIPMTTELPYSYGSHQNSKGICDTLGCLIYQLIILHYMCHLKKANAFNNGMSDLGPPTLVRCDDCCVLPRSRESSHHSRHVVRDSWLFVPPNSHHSVKVYTTLLSKSQTDNPINPFDPTTWRYIQRRAGCCQKL
jgi:hypothetical protein